MSASPEKFADRLPEPPPADPLPTLKAWLDEAIERRIQPNPNAMTLATAAPDGRPAARIVLCKELDEHAGRLVFFTNRKSRKGRDLEATPYAALLFHWDALDRQARIEGPVTALDDAENDAYFRTRPVVSRLGAWASNQSEPIESRRALDEQVRQAAERFGVDLDNPEAGEVEIPRPPHWGGYGLWAERVELWLGQSGRLHDRALWTRALMRRGDGCEAGPWSVTRLQP